MDQVARPSQTTAFLCLYCQATVKWLFYDNSNDPIESINLDFSHQPNSRDLLQSSRSCSFCAALYSVFPDDLRARQNKFFRIGPMHRIRGGEGPSYITVLFRNCKSGPSLEFNFWSLAPNSHLTKRAIWNSQEIKLEDRLNVIKQWFHDCSSHSRCRDDVNVRSDVYPHRLILVGSNHGRITLQLVDTSSMIEKHRKSYTTLSHCWGPSTAYPSVKTTNANLTMHMQCIYFETIPRTYQDALVLTQRLGISYCWIDALCIIQDNEADWRQEASKMGSIYQNSTLTIAATSSVDSRGGCFIDLSNSSLRVGMHSNTTVGHQATTYRMKRDISWDKALLEAPLNQRGWALQELALSPRTLHCTKDGMLWQCRQRCTSEDAIIDNESFIGLTLSDSLPGLDFSGYHRSVRFWWFLAENYSSRQLTYEKDKLPALAGIINYFETRLEDTMILGLWKKNFEHGLGWRVPSPLSSLSHEVLDLPSWTWLSARAPIKLRHDPYENRAKVVKLVDWNVDWADQPFTSKLKSAKLVISAYIITINVQSLTFQFYWPDSIGVSETPSEMTLLLLCEYNEFLCKGSLFISISQVCDHPLTYRRIGTGDIIGAQGEGSPFENAERREIQLV